MFRSLLRIAPALVLLPFASAQGAAPPQTHVGDDLIGSAVGEQQSAALSVGSASTLAVWSDGRSDLAAYGEQTSRDIFAARLDSAGVLLDATPIPIAVAHGEQTSPRAVWDGQQWLVTWVSQTETQFYYDFRVFGMRVGADGSLLDPAPIELLDAGGNSLVGYDVASNGTGWLVIGQADTGGGIHARRVSSAGVLLDPVPVTLVSGTFFLYFDIQLESAGGEYLLTYDGTQSSLDDWQAQRFDSSLNPIGALFTVPIGTVVTASPVSYLLASSTANRIVAQRMLPDGTLLDATPFPVTAVGVGPTYGLSTTYDGTNWWIAYDVGGVSFPELRGSRVTLAGQPLDPNGVVIAPSTASIYTTIGPASGGGVFAVWEQGPSFRSLHAAHTGPDLVLSPDFPLGRSAPSQEFVDATGYSGGHALAWTSYAGDVNRIVVQLTDSWGRATSAPIDVATGAVGVARIAWNGALFFVTWSEGGQALGRRMLPDGTFLDALPITVMVGSSPDVEALGDDFLVVATDVFPGLGSHFVHPYAMRVDGPTGALLDPAPQILGQYFARYPRITTAGGRWLVTWQRNYSHDDPGAEIRATFVDANGVATPDFNVGFGGTPRAASSSSTVMLAWRSGTDSSSDHEILGRRMALDGTLLGAAFTAATAADKQQRPTITWTGRDFLLAWEDMRESVVFFDERTDVYGARYSEAGVPLDGDGISLFRGDLPVKRPVLSTSNGMALLTASAFDLSPGFVSYRLRSAVTGCFVASPREVSLSAGGTQSWELDAGSGYGGHVYFVLGTKSAEGITSVSGIDLALVADDYFSATVRFRNSSIYQQSLGFLDSNGAASAALVVPPATNPALVGLELHHSFVVYHPATLTVETGSNRAPISLLP